MNIKILVGVLVVGVLGLVIVPPLVSNKGEAVQNEGAVGEEVLREASLPVDFPANIPLYPEATIVSVQEVAEETVRNITLSLETVDSVADVNTWYRGALSENGWAVTSDQNVGGYILLKGENENVAVFTQAASRSDLGVVVITERIQIK